MGFGSWPALLPYVKFSMDTAQKIILWHHIPRSPVPHLGTVVFTNGCFDILHRGHIECLEKARSLGDTLVVGLNDDDSVRRLKGPSRPINNEIDRARVLAALECVDYVVTFPQDTPELLIQQVKPEILVKGDDWAGKEVAGAHFVIANGGRVVFVPLVPNHSTTRTLELCKL